MSNFFNAYEKVSHSEMEDVALQILHECCAQDDEKVAPTDLLRLMNAAHISPHSTCPDGKTLGFYLAREMSLPVLMAYEHVGGNLTDRDTHGNTLLFEALSGFNIFWGNDYDVACVDWLIQKGVDVNHTNNAGQTAVFGVHHILKHSDIRRVISSETNEDDFKKRFAEYIQLLELAQHRGANLRHKCAKGFECFDVYEGSEFDGLQQHLNTYRAQLEKSVLNNSVQQTKATSARKM